MRWLVQRFLKFLPYTAIDETPVFTIEEKNEIEELRNTATQELRAHFRDEYFEVLDNPPQSKARVAIIKTTVRYDLGNRALRYFVGFGAGQAKATVKMDVVDSESGVIVATNTYQDTMSMAGFGGNSIEAIVDIVSEAQDEIIEKINTIKRTTSPSLSH